MSKFVLTAQLQLQAPTNVGAVVQQIQNQLSGVSVNVQVQNAAKAQQQLQQVGASANQAASSAERMGKAFALSVRRFAAFSIATRAVGLFTSTLSDAVQTAIDFERQLVKIVQVTGKSASQLRGLTDEISGLSTSLGVSSNSLLEVTTVLAQAGLSANDTTIALNALAKSALAPNFDSITETAEGAIAILAQFKQGVGALERQLSSIDAVAGAFAVEASDLIDVVRRAGGVFKASGGNLNELLALFTSVRATTRESAESIGTGLRTIFTRIQRPQTIEFLKQFGIELVDLNGKFVGPYEAVRRLSEALSGLGEGDITFIKIAEELGGFRQIGKVLPLLQQFSTAQAALNVAQNASNGLAENAATAQLALAVRITKVREEFLKLVRDITSTDTFQFMANGALALASALIKIADSIKPLIPLLAAVAAVKLTKGIGSFLGGIGKGAMSGQTFNKGGKVHAFATGGLVPGSGNSDTVPAMLTPGEFVIRKSSVAKLGASNLAAMNENKYARGGIIQKFAIGGIASENKVAAAIPDAITSSPYPPIEDKAKISLGNVLSTKTGFGILASKSIKDLYSTKTPNAKIKGKVSSAELSAIANKIVGFDSKTYGTLSEGVTSDDAQNFNNIVDSNIKNAIQDGAVNWAKTVGVDINKNNLTFANNFKLPGGFKGSYFESVLDSFQGRPIGEQAAESNRPFDFTSGLKPIGTLFNNIASQGIKYVDAKVSGGSGNIGSSVFATKITNQLASDLISSNEFQNAILQTSEQKIQRSLGGIIQKFAGGGLASAPLIDDIKNASNTLLPKPGSAVAALIKAGGGAIDIDRTLKRTIGDKAYASAKSDAARSQVLERYFRDPNARLRDIQSAPLTSFGKELQSAIQSKQLSPGKLSIVSKSARTPGVAEYLSKLFGIPISNIMFTSGGSKQPAIDAMRLKGPRSERVAKFATGGGVGTDTVPALLTPGEFVINRSSAQRIGYGNLNRMNKIGKYAKGGFVGVQKFAQAGPVKPVSGMTMGSPGSIPGQTQSTTATAKNTQVIIQNTQAHDDNTDKTSSMADSAFGAFMALGGVTAGLTAITPVIDENSSAFERVTASILNSTNSLVTTLGATVIALQQFGLSLNAANLASLAKGTMQFLSGTKSVSDVLTSLKNAIPGVNNFINSLKIAGGKGGGNFVMAPSRAGEMAGSALNKASDLFSGGRSALNSTKIGTSINQVGDIASSAFRGGMQNKSGLFSAVKSGAIGNNPFVNMSGSAGTKATLTSMSNASGLEKVFSQFSGKLGQIFGDLSKGFTAGKAGTAFQTVKSLQPFAKMGGFMGKTAQAAMPSAVSNSAVGSIGQGIGAATKTLTNAFGKVTAGFDKFGGVLLGVQIATSVLAGGFNALFDLQTKANKALDDYTKGLQGDVNKVAEASIDVAAQDSIDSLGSSAITAGAAIGSIVPGFGTVAGALAGATVALSAKFLPALEKAISGTDYISYGFIQAGTLLGGNTYDSIKTLAIAQAEGAKAQKALTDSSEKVNKAMQDLQNGTLSASQALASNAAEASQVNKAVEARKAAATANEGNKSGMVGGFLRGAARVGTLGLAGYMGLESGAQRNARIDKENKDMTNQSKQEQSTLIQQSTPAINALSGDVAAAGGTFQDVMDQIKDTNPGLYFALLSQGTNDLSKSFENIRKETQRAKDAFEAMNLGMQNVQGAASAAALGVNNYIASQQAGNIKLEQSLSVLEASVTSAAQGISEVDFEAAVGDAEKTLRGFGANDKQISKFTGNLRAVNEVQKNQATIFADTKDKLAADIRKSTSPTQRKDVFSKTIEERLKAQNFDPDVIKRFKDATANLSDDQLKKIGEGDFTAFEDAIGELGKKTLEQVNGPLKAAIEIQKQLNELTKQRIEAERNLMAAQMEAADVRMEALDIQAKYGGDIVTPQMRAASVVQKANIQTTGISGVSAMQTGSAAEISRRTSEISARQAEISNIRNMAAAGNAGAQSQLEGQAGLQLQEEEKRLAELSKNQIQTTRDLIKAKEDELKIVKEKNQLEKSSADALVSGDIMKFFEQQSAVGAQAAIATGDQTLMNQYGSAALGMAAQDIRRQQEAGVQDLYGQKLAGPGGLTERAYGAAISSTGVQNADLAKVAAGTTAEEAAIESDIRDLAGTMGPSADLQVSAANQQLQAAQIQLQAAQARQQEAVDQMGARQMSRGGPVYASRGIFVPRGTDTVPAMLTPGEFVVRREAVNRGNNLQILQSMNRGSQTAAVSSNAGGAATMASGGIVKYRQKGSTGPEGGGGFGINPEIVNKFVEALNNFNTQLSDNITRLSETKFQISLSPTNINVNLNGTSFLENLTTSIKQDLINFVGQEISNYSVGNDGKLRKSGNVTPIVT